MIKTKKRDRKRYFFCSAKDLNRKFKKLLSMNLDMIERSNWDLNQQDELGVFGVR